MPKKVLIELQTRAVAVEPVKDGPFAGCPQTQSVLYVRRFRRDTSRLSFTKPHNTITLYGKKYRISSLGITHPTIGIIATEKEIIELLANAKAKRHRWKRKVENKVDGRKVLAAAIYRDSLN